jgi:serine/threonine protein kinase
VWAFGVCVWQVALLGVRPYPEVTDDDAVKDGVCGGRLRLTAPPAMLPDLWAIVERCMRFNPKERPTFERLTMELKRAAIGWYRDVAGTLMASSSTE